MAVIPMAAKPSPIASKINGNSGLATHVPTRLARIRSATLVARYTMILVIFILSPDNTIPNDSTANLVLVACWREADRRITGDSRTRISQSEMCFSISTKSVCPMWVSLLILLVSMKPTL